MKQLYTELQEAGWEKEDIEKIPDKLAWKMAGSNKIKEKEYMGDGENEDHYMEQEEIDEREGRVRNEPSGEGY